MSITYRIFDTPCPVLDIREDYIIAGDGVYRMLPYFGVRVPVPLLPFEIRGLTPLLPWLRSNIAVPLSAADDDGDYFPVRYHVLTEAQPDVPHLDPNCLYHYIIAREGLFLLASCNGLEVLMPIAPRVLLPDLASVTPLIRPTCPRIPAQVLLDLLARAQAAQDEGGHPLERLFYLLWEEGAWQLYEPQQEASSTHVLATETTWEYLSASLEGHSHHRFAARFSRQDDLAEVSNGGCRVYFVLGCIFSQPELRVRICLHGYAWEVPATCFFLLPEGIKDCVGQEWGLDHDHPYR